MAKEVETIRADAQTVASVRLTVDRDELGSALDEVLPEIMEQLSREGVEATGPPFTRFHRSEGKSLEIEAGLPVGARVAGGGRVRASELPGGEAATIWHIGSYATIGESFGHLSSWFAKFRKVQGDGPWEVYVTDPLKDPDPDHWRTHIIWPIGEGEPDSGEGGIQAAPEWRSSSR
ncbi:MAG TPA: GyrI-like domain-containing protein [Thermoleophilia bacterium]|nr:GyrI-like domain-containing protein [Thermoleophilia bacterium]